MTPKNKSRLLFFLTGVLASVLILAYLKHADESRRLPDAAQNQTQWRGVDTGYVSTLPATRTAP